MGTIWAKEPAIIIGAAFTVLLNVIATLAGQGFITDALAGQITDILGGLSGLVIALLPLITALLVRGRVYSPATFDAKD